MDENSIANTFAKYFCVVRADTDELRKLVYNIRYEVYCREFSYEREEDCPGQMEQDEYDAQSKHCLLIHRSTGTPAGCIRLVCPCKDTPEALLPFERFCGESLDKGKFDLSNLKAGTYGEISRLAVLSSFRRRTEDAHTPTGIGQDVNPDPSGRRSSFPFMPVGLVLAIFNVFLNSDLQYAFCMMEPRLARLLKRYGIIFTQVGDIMDYHGPRGPFVITREEITANLNPEVYDLMFLIKKQLLREVPDTQIVLSGQLAL